MRIYDLDGIETDVQDHKFFIDEDILAQQSESIEEIISYCGSWDNNIPD